MDGWMDDEISLLCHYVLDLYAVWDVQLIGLPCSAFSWVVCWRHACTQKWGTHQNHRTSFQHHVKSHAPSIICLELLDCQAVAFHLRLFSSICTNALRTLYQQHFALTHKHFHSSSLIHSRELSCFLGYLKYVFRCWSSLAQSRVRLKKLPNISQEEADI